METLSDFDFDAQPKRQSVYDWDSWADGEIRRLTAGEDYHGEASNVIVAAVRNAKRRGMKLLYDVVEENGMPESVIIQAVGVDP